jgi:hypothetical protein
VVAESRGPDAVVVELKFEEPSLLVAARLWAASERRASVVLAGSSHPLFKPS